MCLFLGEKIEFLKIHAYGGNLLTETHINKPLRKEFFIIIAGPLSHLIIYLLNYLLLRECLILMHTYNLIKSYNTVILLLIYCQSGLLMAENFYFYL